jgi:hypothetical protein
LQPSDDPLSLWSPESSNIFLFTATDETEHGKVEFETTVDATAPTPRDLGELALCRMACMYIVHHLKGLALKDAARSLYDIYSWQCTQARPPLPVTASKIHPISQVRRVQRVPFAVDED